VIQIGDQSVFCKIKVQKVAKSLPVICNWALHGEVAMITFCGFANTVVAGSWLKKKQGNYRWIQSLRIRCEHLFAEGKDCHGLDRARSRGLDAMQEQALLTAVVQNLKRLCRFQKNVGEPALWHAQNRNP
jgi:Transposase DDE domain